MDRSMPRSVQRFSMASKIVRLLTSLVSNIPDRSLTILATDVTHELSDEFKAFIKMCQVGTEVGETGRE